MIENEVIFFSKTIEKCKNSCHITVDVHFGILMYPMSVQWNPSLMFLDLRIFLIQWSF
jgi:hypothetical protein